MNTWRIYIYVNIMHNIHVYSTYYMYTLCIYIYISAVKFKILGFSGELKILTFLFSRISNL